MAVKEAIEKLYALFSQYTLKGRLEFCPCGCIPKEREVQIYQAPLRLLSAEQLSLYSHKAISTWGAASDFKHFLPRIIELIFDDEFGQSAAWAALHSKFVLAEWLTWPDEEQAIIRDLNLLSWQKSIERGALFINEFDGFARYHSLKVLFDMWNYPEDSKKLLEFVDFCIHEKAYLFERKKKIIFGDLDHTEELLTALKKDKLAESLENLFTESMGNEEIEWKVSLVLDYIQAPDK